jgi:hypothetical protein
MLQKLHILGNWEDPKRRVEIVISLLLEQGNQEATLGANIV